MWRITLKSIVYCLTIKTNLNLIIYTGDTLALFDCIVEPVLVTSGLWSKNIQIWMAKTLSTLDIVLEKNECYYAKGCANEQGLRMYVKNN